MANQDGSSRAYDEDGLRVRWSSGPCEEERAARAAWRAVPLARLVAWQQSSADVEVHFALPPGGFEGWRSSPRVYIPKRASQPSTFPAFTGGYQ